MPACLYLASKSPRRLEILRNLGYAVVPLPQGGSSPFAFEGDEERAPGESSADYVLRTARTKALQAFEEIRSRNLPRRPVVAADTTVVLGEDILGKPRDKTEELQFLRRLSCQTHIVRTAVFAGTDEANLRGLVSESRVTFGRITPEDMLAYASCNEPYDKAGGYAVQGLAAAFIEKIEGSYSGIMGLPVYETAALLREFGCGPFQD